MHGKCQVLEEVDTFTGLVFSKLDMIPQDGQQSILLDIDRLHIRVEKVEDHRIAYAQITKRPLPQTPENED